MKNTSLKGFTLIEILIVVAIIAILASVVLVGLGPTQKAGRDARRLSDLRSVQTGLELFFNKCGYYPNSMAAGVCGTTQPTTWADMAAALTGAGGVGVAQVPQDPSSNRSYSYAYNAGNTGYIVSAALENSVPNGYSAPDTTGYTFVHDAMTIYASACSGAPTGGAGADYCLAL